jgi:hypothetical protein
MKTAKDNVSVNPGISLEQKNMLAAGVEITVPNGQETALLDVRPVTDMPQINVSHV